MQMPEITVKFDDDKRKLEPTTFILWTFYLPYLSNGLSRYWVLFNSAGPLRVSP